MLYVATTAQPVDGIGYNSVFQNDQNISKQLLLFFFAFPGYMRLEVISAR